MPGARGPFLGLADLLGGGQLFGVPFQRGGEDRLGGGLLEGLCPVGGGSGDDVGDVGVAATGIPT